ADAFRTVRKNTILIAQEVPEEQYAFRPAPDTRSIGQTLTHIALGSGFQHQVHDNKVTDLATMNFQELFQTFGAEEAKPRTKGEVIEFLNSEGETFASFLEGLDESFLAETVKMMPGATPAEKTRFEMLLGAKEHEMHHRGQLMTM